VPAAAATGAAAAMPAGSHAPRASVHPQPALAGRRRGGRPEMGMGGRRGEKAGGEELGGSSGERIRSGGGGGKKSMDRRERGWG